MKGIRVVLIVIGSIGAANADVNVPLSENNNNLMVVNIWLNGVDRNIEALLLTSKDGEYIECSPLEDLGVSTSSFQRNKEKDNYCLMSGPDVKFEKDETLQAVKINVPASYFASVPYKDTIIIPKRANFGGFVNYDLFYSKDDFDNQFNALTEIGIFKDYWIFTNSFIYRDSPTDTEQDVVRVGSLFELEFPENYTKFRLGDNTSVYSTLTNSFRYGGISFGTNFTERPDFVYWNMPTLNGSAVLPSTVDLYINGVNLYNQSVTPGNYSLQSGASINQSGEAQIVVRDILGNQTVQSFPIYISSQLLRKDLNEYDISLGKLRYNYDDDSNDYREFFTKLYFRRGVTQNTTLGFDATYSEEVSNLSFLWTQALGTFALLDTAYAASEDDGTIGYALSVSLSKSYGRWSFGYNGRYYTDQYEPLGYSDSEFNTKLSNLAYINVSKLGFFDGLSLSYVNNINYKGGAFQTQDSRIINFGAAKRITDKLYASINCSKNFEDDQDDNFNIALTYDWNSRSSVSIEHNTDDNDTEISYSRRSYNPYGFDYALAVSNQDSDVNFHGFGLLKSRVGDLSLSYDEYPDNRTSRAQFQGALVFLDKKVALTKYVDDAFTLVDLNGMENIEVLRSLSSVGESNKKGYLFVHDIVPYINYDISYNQDQLPLDYSVDQASQQLSALNQRGYVLNFPILKTKKFTFKLLNENGEKFLLGTLVRINGGNEENYFVDSDGLFYLYLAKPTQYNIKVVSQGNQICNASLNVSQHQISGSENEIINLICK
ncbi:fimbria/pilus outer membrane usher protein [Acinetobacter sp. ANC 4173]|uniref:fimbria/pilus outer membrane usher protein n=1 Tax=Acinetobacter sp. ANC 4173 TaxID=2529837 RepID=UPI00103BBBD6|nr:fimbria/pilus outer membrane usher protein [Acinetobacter sp. ANC 4173]TCB78885.1 fimbrial biogenesis outer membrane usher protein [Acinetobacter sp. ANC 4173]